GEHKITRLVVDARLHGDDAGRALRLKRHDRQRRIERVADIDTFQEPRRLFDEGDERVVYLVRELARSRCREAHDLEAVREEGTVPVRAAVLDVVVDRMVVAGQELERGEMRFR